MLTFILIAGFVFMVGIGWFAYRLIRQSAQEPLGSSEINNVGDLNKNNVRMGQWGIHGL